MNDLVCVPPTRDHFRDLKRLRPACLTIRRSFSAIQKNAQLSDIIKVIEFIRFPHKNRARIAFFSCSDRSSRFCEIVRARLFSLPQNNGLYLEGCARLQLAAERWSSARLELELLVAADLSMQSCCCCVSVRELL